MAVERYGSKTDVVVKLVLVFFISLLSFSIGTFVGKKFSDNQHKLSQLEPNSLDGSGAEAVAEHGADTKTHEDRSLASIAPGANEVVPGHALSDEEIAKLAEEFVTDDEGATKKEEHKTDKVEDGHHVAAAPPAHEEPPSKDKKVEPPSHAAEKVAAGHEPTHEVKVSEEKTSRIPASLPKEVAASAVGKYTVQVASYPKESEAQNMSNDLKTKGFSAFYVTAKVRGETWYRVSVGLFATQKEAQAYRTDLLARAKVSSAMVQKIIE